MISFLLLLLLLLLLQLHASLCRNIGDNVPAHKFIQAACICDASHASRFFLAVPVLSMVATRVSLPLLDLGLIAVGR
jgi:hypothetical protein